MVGYYSWVKFSCLTKVYDSIFPVIYQKRGGGDICFSQLHPSLLSYASCLSCHSGLPCWWFVEPFLPSLLSRPRPRQQARFKLIKTTKAHGQKLTIVLIFILIKIKTTQLLPVARSSRARKTKEGRQQGGNRGCSKPLLCSYPSHPML